MRYLSCLFIVSLAMFIISGCKEESPSSQTASEPAVKEAPQNIVEQAKQDVDMSMAKTEEESQKVMDHIKEESHKAMEHAQSEAHKTMAATHEGSTMDVANDQSLATGKAVYEKTCIACHATGVAGAPKMGDKEAWSAHIHHGVDHMIESVIHGKGAMPVRGGNSNLSDEDIKAAVNYIVEQNR